MKGSYRVLNYALIVFGLLLAFYYYRICNRVLDHYSGEKDHIDAIIYLIYLGMVAFGVIRYSFLLRIPLATIMLLFVSYIFINGEVYAILGIVNIRDLFKSFMWAMPFMCLLFYYERDKRDERIVLFTMFVVSLICILCGILGMSWFALETVLNDVDEIDEIVNIVAFSVITLPFVMIYKNVFVRLGLFAAIAVVVVLSMRRIASICLVLVAVLMLIDSSHNNAQNKGFAKHFLSFLLIALLAYFGYQLVTGELSAIFDNVLLRFSEMGESGGSGRTDLWADVIRKLDDNSFLAWIFGNGYLGVDRLAKHTAAHNEFLEVLFDFGVVGLILYTLLHYYLIKRIVFLFKRNSVFKYPYLGSYVIFFLYSMLGNVIIYPQYAFSLFVFWGFVEKKLYIIEKRK